MLFFCIFIYANIVKMKSKNKLPLTVPIIIPENYHYLGERRGKFMDDMYKPKPPVGFKKRTNKKKTSNYAYQTEEYKEKQRLLEERKKKLKLNPTEAELLFWYNLKKYKIGHLFQKGVIDGNYFMIADFYIKKLNIVVELDGAYHDEKSQQSRDYFKDKHYSERGFKILRMKNEDVVSFNFEELNKSYKNGKPTEYLEKLLK